MVGPGIHPNDGLLWKILTTNRAEVAIVLHRGGDEVRGVMEFFFYLMIPKFVFSRELTGVDFT